MGGIFQIPMAFVRVVYPKCRYRLNIHALLQIYVCSIIKQFSILYLRVLRWTAKGRRVKLGAEYIWGHLGVAVACPQSHVRLC